MSVKITRKQWQRAKPLRLALNFFATHCPELLGGSADLTGSNSTDWSGTQSYLSQSLAWELPPLRCT